jgi:hypothetical protein
VYSVKNYIKTAITADSRCTREENKKRALNLRSYLIKANIVANGEGLIIINIMNNLLPNGQYDTISLLTRSESDSTNYLRDININDYVRELVCAFSTDDDIHVLDTHYTDDGEVHVDTCEIMMAEQKSAVINCVHKSGLYKNT